MERYLGRSWPVAKDCKLETLSSTKQVQTYKVTKTKDESQLIVKVKQFMFNKDREAVEVFKELKELGEHQQNYLTKMAKIVPIAEPVGCGNINEIEMQINVTQLMPGKKATMKDLRDKKCVMAIAKYLADLHEASREVGAKIPETYKYFEAQGAKGEGNTAQSARLGKTPEHYGLVHGDFSFENFNIVKSASGDYQVRAFDFEKVCPAYFLCDLGRMIKSGALIIQKSLNDDEGEYAIYKMQRQFYEWALEGYNKGKYQVDEKIFRRQFLPNEVLTALDKLEQEEQKMKMFHKHFRQQF